MKDIFKYYSLFFIVTNCHKLKYRFCNRIWITVYETSDRNKWARQDKCRNFQCRWCTLNHHKYSKSLRSAYCSKQVLVCKQIKHQSIYAVLQFLSQLKPIEMEGLPGPACGFQGNKLLIDQDGHSYVKESAPKGNKIYWKCRYRIHSFIHPSLHSSIPPFIHPSIYPFIHSFIHPSFHSSIHPFIHSSIHPYIHSSIHPFIRSSVRLLDRFSVCPFACSSTLSLLCIFIIICLGISAQVNALRGQHQL